MFVQDCQKMVTKDSSERPWLYRHWRLRKLLCLSVSVYTASRNRPPCVTLSLNVRVFFDDESLKKILELPGLGSNKGIVEVKNET